MSGAFYFACLKDNLFSGVWAEWSNKRRSDVREGMEQLNREIRRRTGVVGSFPDGNSALMLVCIRLRHVATTQNEATI